MLLVKHILCLLIPLHFCILLFSQTGTQPITGLVTGSDNAPLSGATISLKGSNRAVFTQKDGSFSITAKAGDILEISFVGFKTRQITITDETSLKITLSASILSLEEVVLTGYTAQKIKEITGSVAVVKPRDLAAIPAGQVEQMLQGRVAGLNVITSGLPGSKSNVRIHGIGNFGDVTPLYIIDGVQGDINNLNPNDIESLQVLKDAGAYSIYGVRGANGVIVITTRNGKTSKTKISYDFYMGLTEPLNKDLELLNPQELADLTWLALKNSNQPLYSPLYGNGSSPVVPDYFIAGENLGLPASDPRADPSKYNIDFTNGNIYQIVQANKTGTDWFHELYQPAFSQNHSLAVSGANEKNKYLFSLGYLDQEGCLLNTWLKRFTARVNTLFSVADAIRIGENLQWTYRDHGGIPDYGSPLDNDMFRVLTTHPLLPVYDIKGGWAHLIPLAFYDNPYAGRAQAKDDKSQSWETFGNAYAEVDFLDNFTFRTSFGGSLVNYYSSRFDFWSYYQRPDTLPNNAFNESSGYRRSWTWTNTLSFSKTLGKDHHLTALAGTEAINSYNREVGGRSVGLYTNDVNYRFLSNGNPRLRSNYSFAGTSSLFAFISQVDYGFREKYFLRGTLRRDGASFFGPKNRYGWFPAVSMAWRMGEEKFLKSFTWMDELKLRASWGKSGFYGNTDPSNQYTLYGGTVADAYYDISGTGNMARQGFRAVRLGDPNTGWQEDVVTNLGIESVFWNGRLAVTLDWYKKTAKGLLFPVTLPDVLGGSIPPNVNVGRVQNTGFDILLGSKGQWSKYGTWDVALTMSAYENKILRLSDLPYFIPPAVEGRAYVKNEVGHPVSSFYGFKILGIFKDESEVARAPEQEDKKPGRFRYWDANGDNVINAEDRVYLGDANPDFTLGINLGFTYKNFDFSTFFYGSFGNEVINYPKIKTDFYFPENTAKSRALLYDSWTPSRTEALLPVAELDFNFSNVQTTNSYVIENGSYFRNKSLIVGYTFPRAWLQKARIESLRMYVQAVNLFTITQYTGLDPELSGNSAAFGIDYGNFPNNQQQYVLGLSLKFN